MRIGELSSAVGVSVRVLRHYESRGLIQSSRNANGYREYPESTVEVVRQIRLLLDCGFSTRQIYGFLPCFGEGKSFDSANCAAGLEQYIAKRNELDQLIEVLKQRRNRLSERIVSFNVASPKQSKEKRNSAV
jgi:DNA-binding transcriptional MerR regulator